MASPSVYHYSRKNEENNDDEDVYTYHITLEQTTSESDVDLSDAESIESVQANTTVSAKDSSDISTDELSDYLMSEYEIASSPESIEKSIYEKEMFSSSSSPRDIEFVFSCSESENSNVTDASDYDSDYLILGDNKFYHTCAQCFSRNENPAFRFCDSCYQSRKESFLTKPTRKRKRTEVDHPSKKLRACAETNASDSGPNEETATTAEAKSSDQAASIDDSLSQETAKSSDVATSIMDSGFESLSPSQEWDFSEPKEKCLTCLNNTVNGLFLHGRTAHKCCCYQCSKRIWSKSRRCPICRRKIHNVVLLLNC